MTRSINQMYLGTDENPTQSIYAAPIINERHEAFLLYNGAPASEDDPADYYGTLKAVRIA